MSVYTGSTGQDIVEVETGIKVGFTPAIPTPITSSIKEENNRVMRSYLWSERVSLPVGTGNNSGFITFATKKPVASNRDIFLAFNGKVIGHLKKDASLSTEANEYKYDVKKIPMVEGNRNLWNYVNKDGEVTVMAYVGDGTNYVTMVAIELD